MNDNTNNTTASSYRAEKLLNLILGGAEDRRHPRSKHHHGDELGYIVRFPQGNPIRFWIEIHATDEAGEIHATDELVVDISRDALTADYKATIWHERAKLAEAHVYESCVGDAAANGWSFIDSTAARGSEWNEANYSFKAIAPTYERFHRSLVKGAVDAFANLVAS